MFEVIPCVDVRLGRAVRLLEGDPARETVYHSDPLDAARRFDSLGAPWIHIVDLDAALGTGSNLEGIEAATRGVRASVEVAGGIRSSHDAALRLEFADRVVVGTAAVREPRLVHELLERFGPRRVVVSVDARHGEVAVSGWTEATGVRASDLARAMHAAGVETLIFTDVSRDGTMKGVDEVPVRSVRDAFPGTLYAGGGVGSDSDLELYESLGLQGAIVGRAIYEGKITYPRTA
ncbi:MAG TPA: 1-(5-phosphoribosyl)-5-[(5-phosphoribosylamino)methylideneamino] imidazole-4-carboxamide isomerase [Trueperaceae bacterium]|nr:1-(5-phosphoribosyl)-5-[(5-phosphoribosylamino)methylideneamino] imidazole-4-carboxamide isomerase [Trueperaceae bacterium]